ncbi:MAG: CpaF family protein, partial [Syntrophomonadaceae bacterium]|nr:CpaF family protein [Syntrophomonadaceae bacterium]
MSLLQKRLMEQRMNQTDQNQTAVPKSQTYARKQIWQQVKETVLKRVAEYVSPEEIEQLPAGEQEKYLNDQIRIILDAVMKEMKFSPARAEYHRLIAELVSEVNGYGPITPLLADPEINEIMVNGPDQVYVERLGQLELTDIVFKDHNHVMHIIEKIVAPLGKRIDEASPMVDARLPDGSRINATIPPVSIDGPVLTIRKFATKALVMSDLIRAGTLTTNMAVFLKACVEGRLNIIVAGGTSSGKTTTLNVLTSFIPNHERVITIEDAAELQLQQDHVIRMEARPANIEGKGRISIRELVINSLRMRPDRLIVGEVRGAETLDMMQAMNTGHEGSMTTAHANSPRDLLSRMETMVLMAGVDMP